MSRLGRVAACLVLVTHAVNAAPVRVLLVHAADPGDELRGMVARASAELVALGFDVVLVESADAGALDRQARDAGAVAAMQVGPPGAGIKVYVVDSATAQPSVQQVLLGTAGDPATLSVRAVELVRASLLEVEQRHAVIRASATPGPHVAAPVERRLALEAGPAIAVSRGGVSATLHVAAAARWHVNPYLELGAGVLAPTAPGTVTAAAGSASITLTAPTLEANLLGRVAGVELRGGLGAGVLWGRMHGTPVPGFVGRTDDVTTGLGFARVSIGRALTSTLRVWFDARLAVAAPRPVVLFAGQPVASWGRPAAIAALGLELDVF